MECVHANTQETYYYINEATTYISMRHIKIEGEEDLTNYHVFVWNLENSNFVLGAIMFPES